MLLKSEATLKPPAVCCGNGTRAPRRVSTGGDGSPSAAEDGVCCTPQATCANKRTLFRCVRPDITIHRYIDSLDTLCPSSLQRERERENQSSSKMYAHHMYVLYIYTSLQRANSTRKYMHITHTHTRTNMQHMPSSLQPTKLDIEIVGATTRGVAYSKTA